MAPRRALVTHPPPLSIRLLHDDAGLWRRAADILGERTAVLDGATDAVGILTWKRATRAEVAQLAEVREQHAGPVVAILSELPSTRGARAVAARVEGSVLVEELEHTLLPTLVAVSAGQCVVPRSVRQLVDRPPLSPRERQVLAMVVLDCSNAEIAEKLVVTESNVKNHLTSAFSKLGVTSRAAATELILDGESGLGLGILRITPEDD